MVASTHHVAIHASQIGDEGDGMLPEQEIAARPVPFADVGRGLLNAGRLRPGIVLAARVEVADVEEHLVGRQIFLRMDIASIEEGTFGVFLMEPKPGARLVVITVLHDVLGAGIRAQESHARHIGRLLFCAEEGGFAVIEHPIDNGIGTDVIGGGGSKGREADFEGAVFAHFSSLHLLLGTDRSAVEESTSHPRQSRPVGNDFGRHDGSSGRNTFSTNNLQSYRALAVEVDLFHLGDVEALHGLVCEQHIHSLLSANQGSQKEHEQCREE